MERITQSTATGYQRMVKKIKNTYGMDVAPHLTGLFKTCATTVLNNLKKQSLFSVQIKCHHPGPPHRFSVMSEIISEKKKETFCNKLKYTKKKKM